MDLQKVKEYLEEIATRDIEDNALDPEWPNIVAKKALAELENKDESALSTVIKWAEGYFDHDIITGAIHESLAVLLNQYAESYHAKKCAEVLSSAADRAMAVYARDCEGCSPRLSDDCDERCPYIAKIRKAIMEATRA